MGSAPPIEVANLGMADSLILMVLALVVFGPRRLPQIGKQIGKLMYEFRKASNDFKYQMEEELRLSEEADRRKKEEEQRKQLAQESVSAPPAATKTTETPLGAEGTYPATAQVDTEARPDDEVPRIQPPSTGETVAARQVSEQAELSEPPGEAEPPVGETGPEAPASTTSGGSEHASATEAVSQNG